jgi:broad specificity phosphatase PhoE
VKLFFVRHGETDWQALESRGVRGWARSFAPLTPRGRLQIDVIASDYRLEEAEGILTSSYARALESAARLSRALNKPLHVEYDLHEWLPQKDSLGEMDDDIIRDANKQLSYYTGFIPFADRRVRAAPERAPAVERRVPVALRQPPPPEARSWESVEEVRERVLSVLRRYAQLDSLIVVSHAVVISSMLGVQRPIEHAEIVPLEIDLGAPLPSLAGLAEQDARLG